jgi:membrane protein implicated in regulation of membrane protease activity
MGNSRYEGKAVLLPLEADVAAPRSRGAAWILLTAILAAGAVLVSPLPLWIRPIAVAGVLCIALFAALVLHTRRSVRRATPRRQGASIAVDAQGIWRLGSEGDAATVARWDETFGASSRAPTQGAASETPCR